MLERSPADIAITGRVREGIAGRRALFGALVGATIVGMLWLAVDRAVARRVRPRRCAAAVLLRADAALDGGRLLECGDRLPDRPLRRRSAADDNSLRRGRSRRRADHGLDRDPALHPQREPAAAGAQPAGDDGRPCRDRRGEPLSCLRAERHQRPAHRRRPKQQEFAALAAQWQRPPAADLSPARDQHRLQGRQHRRFLRALGQRSRRSR